MTDQFDDFEEELREPPRQVDAEALLREVIDIVALAKPMPLSASVLISRDEVLDRLDEIAERLPEELRQARWLLREREEFMAEQRRDADRLMEDVKAQAERMVSRTELVRQANTTAERIIEEAEESARRMRHEAEDYCDQKLAGMEIVLNRVLKTVSAGRERLQPQLEETMDEQLEEETDEGSDAFFDQDQF
jgi:cell division septum initiation protein DivIVA